MKRYLLFTFDMYYPCGGWNDFSGSFDTVEEAREAGEKARKDYYQVVDSQLGVVVIGD